MNTPVKRIFSASFQATISQILNVIQQLALTPLFLRSWGANTYGEWLVIFATISYLTVIDFGIGHYIVNKLSILWSKKDLRGFHIAYHSGFLVIAIMGGVFLVLLIIISSYLAIFNPLQMSYINKNGLVFFLTIIFLGMELISRFSFNIGAIVYVATGVYPRASYRKNQESVLVILGSVFVLLAGLDWLAISIVRFVCTILMLSLSFIDARRLFPEIRHGFSQAERKEVFSIIREGWWFMGLTGSAMIQQSGSIIALQYFSGPATVTTFSITRTLINLAYQMRYLVCHPFWRESTILYGKQEYAKIKVLYVTLQKLAIYISIFLCTILFFESGTLLQWWIGDKIPYNQGLIIVLLALVLLQSPWIIAEIFPLSWNKPKRVIALHSISSVTGVILGTFLAINYCETGMAIGLMIGELSIVGWLIPRSVGRAMGQSSCEMWREIWFPSIITTMPCFFVSWLITRFVLNPVTELISITSAVILVLVVMVWKIGLSCHEKEQIIQLVKWGRNKFYKCVSMN